MSTIYYLGLAVLTLVPTVLFGANANFISYVPVNW
jgi:hypothetical protein